MSNFIKFNINYYVRVKLTDHGRKLHRQQYRELYNQLPITAMTPYTPPKEDDEGWSKWQLWDLMQRFGPYICISKPPPFETEIEFDVQT